MRTNGAARGQGLTKHFGGLRAVPIFPSSVNPGEILGLIGPNGAGKTTVFNLITGFIRPTAGRFCSTAKIWSA